MKPDASLRRANRSGELCRQVLCQTGMVTLRKRIARPGGLAVPAGTLAVAFSVASLWFLFALKDFSSTVRDAYEAPPGPVQYILLGIVCLILLLISVAGVVVLVLGLTRRPRSD